MNSRGQLMIFVIGIVATTCLFAEASGTAVASNGATVVESDIEMLADRLRGSDLPEDEKLQAMSNLVQMKRDIDEIPMAPPALAGRLRRAVELRLVALREQLQDHEADPSDLVAEDVQTLKEAIKTSGLPEEAQVSALLNVAKIQRDVDQIRVADPERASELREAIKLRLSALNRMLVGNEADRAVSRTAADLSQSAIDESFAETDGLAGILAGIGVVPVMLGLLLGSLVGTATTSTQQDDEQPASEYAATDLDDQGLLGTATVSVGDALQQLPVHAQEDEDQDDDTTNLASPVIEALAALFAPKDESANGENANVDNSAPPLPSMAVPANGDINMQHMELPLLAGGLRCPVMRAMVMPEAVSAPAFPIYRPTFDTQDDDDEDIGALIMRTNKPSDTEIDDMAAATAAAVALAERDHARWNAMPFDRYGSAASYNGLASLGHIFPRLLISEPGYHPPLGTFGQAAMPAFQPPQMPHSMFWLPPTPLAAAAAAALATVPSSGSSLQGEGAAQFPLVGEAKGLLSDVGEEALFEPPSMDVLQLLPARMANNEDDAFNAPSKEEAQGYGDRQPMLLRMDEKDGFHVVSGFFPGVKKEDLHVRLEGEKLFIDAAVTQKDDADLARDNLLHINLANADSFEEELELPYAPAAGLFKAHFNAEKHTFVAVFPVQTEAVIDVE